MATTTPLRFELGVRLTKSGRSRGLPDKPASFRPVQGDYPTVSKRAVQLNDVQNGMAHADYVFL